MSEKQIWTLDELTSLTEEVQSREVEYHGKMVPLQWCELTEGEEPKMSLPDENASEDDKNRHFAELASARVLCMVGKANEKNPEGKFLDDEMWAKLPTTLRWKLQNVVLGTGDEEKENFLNWMGYSPEMVNCFIPLMKGLGMSWSEIKATPQIELNGLLTALGEYNILHSFDGYSEKQVRDMAKDNSDITGQYNDYKTKQRRYNRSERKITSFREILK